MASYPESLRAIVCNAAKASIEIGIDKAVEHAFGKWSAHADYQEWVGQMIRGELRSLIHDVRHEANRTRRRQAGEYGGPAKVTLSTGSVNRIARELMLDYSINGQRLGSLYGKEIPALADAEEARGNGCHRNARLLRAIRPLVPDDKRVDETVSETKAKQLFKSVNETGNGRSRGQVKSIASMNGHSSKHANGKPSERLTATGSVAPVGKHNRNGKATGPVKPSKAMPSRSKNKVAV